METYSIGTKVVHPTHGAGTITAIQDKSLGAESRQYYIIETLADGEASRTRQLMVPVSRAAGSGLRRAGAASGLRDVLHRCVPPIGANIDKDYRSRQESLRELLNSGSFEQVAQAVSTLYVLHTMRPLGVIDRQMFEHGKGIMASEIAVATGSQFGGARREVEDWMSAGCGATDWPECATEAQPDEPLADEPSSGS